MLVAKFEKTIVAFCDFNDENGRYGQDEMCKHYRWSDAKCL
jgi:hypothetical protein